MASFLNSLDLTSLRIPEDYQEPVDYFLCSLIVWALTDTVLDIAWVRHRWRQTVLASKIVGMSSVGLMLIWPSNIAAYGLCLCLFNGFADPRLHLASIRRNPAHPFLKWFFCLTLLGHHTGGAFVVTDMMRIVIKTGQPCAALPIPVIISCLSEIFSWFTDLKVLMRTAPKWFTFAHQLAVCLQLACCLILLILFDPKAIGLCPTTIVGAFVGSASWLFAGMIGFTNSTHEVDMEVDGKASIARVYYKEQPLTRDENVLAYCRKDLSDGQC